MSEIKSEVEYVIKTGRQLVEKKQVDFPRRVNQTLDALKSLYNRLGSQISQARKDLDKALKVRNCKNASNSQLENNLSLFIVMVFYAFENDAHARFLVAL